MAKAVATTVAMTTATTATTVATWAARLLALAAALALAWMLHVYPFGPPGRTWPVMAVAALLPACLLWQALRPASWLFFVPSLLPVLDLAPWTGWFFLEEIDLLLMLVVMCGYARWRPMPQRLPSARLPPAARFCLLLMTLAWLTALLRGLPPLPEMLTGRWPGLSPFDPNAWNNYLSPYNSLRLGKAWAWALLLLPMLRRDGSADNLRRYALPGVLCALAMVGLCALWERAVFPGLSNLASDYRISAPFSAMHTGGAALDGYLALALPFAVLWLARARTRLASAAALLLLALALHAALATFSRSLYAALAASGLLAACCVLGAPGRALPPPRQLAAGLLLGLAAIALLIWIFNAAGYRGLAAALLLLGGAGLVAGLPLPGRLLPASLACALALQALLAMLWPLVVAVPAGAAGQLAGLFKAPYALMLASSVALLLAWSRAQAAASTPAGAMAQPGQGACCAAVMALAIMACNLAWICWHWTGARALPAAAMVALLAVLLLYAAARASTARRRLSYRPGQGNRSRQQPLALRPMAAIESAVAAAPAGLSRRAGHSAAAAAAMLLLLAIPVSASYYAGERFVSTAGDWQGRLRHWQQALAILPQQAAPRLFGMGLGTFPTSYYWHNQPGETPARISYVGQSGQHHVRLASAGYRAGYGEPLRVLQRVEVKPATPYTLSLQVRRPAALPVLQARLCQRLLLYAQHCVNVPLRLPPPTPHWQHLAATFDSRALGQGAWLQRAPVQLELAAIGASQPALIEIGQLSLRGPDGRELLANGSFSEGGTYWFFSSDHHHLPWHIKNIGLQLLIEAGWCGVLAHLLLLVLATACWWRQARAGARDGSGAGAVAMLAASTGFLAVGMFDSLLDVPRLALLFYLLLLCALLHRPASGSGNGSGNAGLSCGPAAAAP